MRLMPDAEPSLEPSPRETLIAERCAEARAAHPRLGLAAADFAAYLSARAPDEAALRSRNAADLYLACAAARADAAALATFEAEILDRLAPALIRAGAGAILDEVKQVVRERLLVAPAGRDPRITDYAGEGTLVTWVRVVALRAAATIRRGAQRSRAREHEALLDTPLPVDSPDLAHLRRRYAGDFKAAFEAGVAGLGPRDRNLLRQHLLDGLTIDDLGALYQINRVTAARWLSRAREEVARATRKALAARLRLSPAELDSVLRLVRSDLDLSIGRVFEGA
jgi:RNA polymerase sigma-70 factor (ECF subfamily)